MKVFKQKEHSLLVKPFGIGETLYLACTVFIFFDLNDPETLLTEQELWAAVPSELGPEAILDAGMTKPRGEMLAIGSCHAPRGTTRPAAEASIRVGPLHKRLHVFGDRYWQRGEGLARVISDPQKFSEMPLTWRNAFGGPGFDLNPVGKGIAGVLDANGQSRHPLPNIEDPGHLIGSPSDRPEPAAFGPLDLMWPQRFKKQGTYDEQWLKQRWPYFPDDMNFEFFNTAPEDQWLDGFFKAGADIEIINMHPDIQAIRSRLPDVRIRCFATKKQSLRSPPGADDVFEEVKTHIDTVWLFPGILRGVATFRGTTRILDDEYADVQRIFIATEQADDAPQTTDHYLEEQRKLLDRKVSLDQAPFEAARKNVATAMKRIKRIPEEIDRIKLRATGKTPVMPRSAAEHQLRAGATLDSAAALISELGAQAKDAQVKYGHLAKIDLESAGALKEKLTRTRERLAQATDRFEKARQSAVQVTRDLSADLKQHVSADQLAKAGVDPDNLMPSKSVNPWHDRGFPLVVQWRKNLEKDRNARDDLRRLGFDRRTIRRAWLGISPEPIADTFEAWGLQHKRDERDREIPLDLPAGLVIPRFRDARLTRILIRTGDFNTPAKETLIEGSDPSPLFLPAMDPEGAPVIRVADDLQGWYLNQEIGDACSVIGLRDPGEKPDEQASEAIQKALAFLIVVPAEYPESGHAVWQDAYPNARVIALPRGKSLFEARQHGIDVREWIMDALPADFSSRHCIAPVLPDPEKPLQPSSLPGFSIPMIDVKEISAALKRDIKAIHQPKIEKAMAVRKEMEAGTREALQSAGRNPDELLGATRPKGEGPSLSDTGRNLAGTIIGQMEGLRAGGHLSAEVENRMRTGARQVSELGEYGERRHNEGMQRLEAAREKALKIKSGEIPEGIKARFAAEGLEPDKLKKTTREEVIEGYARGESFSGTMLDGLDLSGLDLRGIDLSRAQCRQTNFSGSNLSQADLSQTLAQEADFTKACLQEVRSDKGVFSKGVFRNADLTRVVLRMAVFKEADLTEADCSGSNLHMTMLEKAILNKTNFSHAVVNMSVFNSADTSGADFKGARLTKCLFQKAVLDGADFSGAVLGSTMFFGATGASVKFTGADLSKSRMGGQTVLAGADFSSIKMNQGCFRDSDLSEANFQGARIEGSMLEGCDLSQANLAKISCMKSRLSKCNLEGADLRGVNLFLGSLRKARLVKTDLRGANLYGVDFYKAVMGETRLEDANLKMTLLQGRTEYLP